MPTQILALRPTAVKGTEYHMVEREGPFDEALKLLAHIIAKKHLYQQKEFVPLPAEDAGVPLGKDTNVGEEDQEG